MCVSPVYLNRGSREGWQISLGSVGALETARGAESYFPIVRLAKWSLRSCDIIPALCQAAWKRLILADI